MTEPTPSAQKPPASAKRRRAQALWWTNALPWVVPVVCLWGVFAADPSPPLIIALAMMPWLAMLGARVVAPSRLVYRLRANLLAAVMLPGAALGVVALAADGSALDWRIPLTITLILGVAMTILVDVALRGANLARGRTMALLGVFCCMSLYAYGSVSLANAGLDRALPERFHAVVLGKRITHGRYSTHWHLRLPPWGPQAEPSEAEVRASVYRAVQLGDSVCVDLHPGALGIAWYLVEHCALGK
jgi:hypothetical protein